MSAAGHGMRKIEIEVPDPPSELGECVFEFRQLVDGDRTCVGKDWARVCGPMKSWGVVAVPKPLPPLEWDDGSFGEWRAMPYQVFLLRSGMFSAEIDESRITADPCPTLADAKAACERHRRECRKTPVVEQPKPEPPALPDPGPGYRLVDQAGDKPGPTVQVWNKTDSRWEPGLATKGYPFTNRAIYRIPIAPPTPAIEWPEGAICLVKDGCGKRFICFNDISWASEAYAGPDPFPADLPWNKCIIYRPAETR